MVKRRRGARSCRTFLLDDRREPAAIQRGRFRSWNSIAPSVTVGQNRRLPAEAAAQCATMIIQGTPKRSVTMPKLEAKKVLARGIPTVPPSESALKRRSASASLDAASDIDVPANVALPWH